MRLGVALRHLFTRRDLATLALLTFLMVFSGSLEVFGIGMLFPYVAILQDPAEISNMRYVSAVYRGLGFESHRSFLVAMSVFLLAMFCVKGFLALWVTNFQLRFARLKFADLGRALLSRYLHRSYAFFLSANTSVLIGNLTTSVSQLCAVIQSALSLASEVIVAVGLVGFLIFLNPVFSLSALLFIGGLSFLLKRVIRKRITYYANANELHWKAMIRTVNESLSSAKEVNVIGCQDYFVDTYSREVEQYSRAQQHYNVLAQFPRVALETGAVAGLVIFALFAMLGGTFGPNLFAVLAVFSIATVRIVPSATRILQAWNAISFYRPSMDVIAAGLSDAADEADANVAKTPSLSSSLRLQNSLAVSIRSFVYPMNPHFILADIDLTIVKGQTVGLIGQSGSGKTTLVDLILGLFPEFDGRITVDDHDIRENLGAWRKQIGYIPQSIYLRDDTIVRNVAFGVPDSQIDMRAVERAIHLAGLDAVILTQRDGMETLVGDRGIRLSGGERQRIGIARALYHEPELLILDEATSALDNETERQIVDSILGLGLSKTVVVIAHRLSTVENCDIVYLMRSGRIVDRGSFSKIVERSPALVNP
ncbi:MAG TPA: ABC transporter ATP-binding protein [Candidatus Sulfotelmatobacter sp.]